MQTPPSKIRHSAKTPQAPSKPALLWKLRDELSDYYKKNCTWSNFEVDACCPNTPQLQAYPTKWVVSVLDVEPFYVKQLLSDPFPRPFCNSCYFNKATTQGVARNLLASLDYPMDIFCATPVVEDLPKMFVHFGTIFRDRSQAFKDVLIVENSKRKRDEKRVKPNKEKRLI